ncbi:uncharacterized protein LOC141815095 [Curcuma longa]|uniref:uncharacterized protein LOC141815095 n=1 Tax=Curcuma longa TaxID=136217 RepID=UPI003D9E24D5
MAQGEGYSTARPPLFNGEDFPYWKRRMEVYLKTDIDQWFAVQTGYTPPMDEGNNVPLKPERWNPTMKKEAQVEYKAQNTLQCGLTKEELNRIGPTESAKELWDKLIKLHEGTSDAKEGESASQLHARIKEILNGLHLIGHKQENRDIIRYALNAFPRNSLWASIIDAYKISKNLSKINLDELFCELELHEQTNAKAEKGIALFAGSSKERKTKNKPQEESESESDSDSNEEEQLVNLVRKMFTRRKNKFSKRDIQKIMKPFSTEGKSNITCFSCNRKGHFKHECPYKKEDQPKNSKKKKALQATWDESSDDSDDEPPKNSSYLALMATGPGSDSEQDEDSEYESSQEVGLFSDGSTKE